MGDENPIRTLGDYSRPSHEGYRNTIELPEGNNVVPLRSDTIRLVQNGCSFHGLRSEDPNQHLKDFLKLVDSLDLDVANRERTCLQDLALYDNESWNDPRDFTKPVKAISLPQDVLSTSDTRLIELENQVQYLMEAHLAPKQPIQVNKITSSCEICSGPHDTQYCMENPKQAFDYASLHTNEAGGKWYTFKPEQNNLGDTYNPSWKSHPNLRLSKFEAEFKQQQSEMTNKIDTVLKAITDRMAGAIPSNTVKNPKLNVNSTSPVSSARSYPTKSQLQIGMGIETQQTEEHEQTLEDEFKDLHLNLPVLKVLAHAPMYNAILDKYVESLELSKNRYIEYTHLADLGACVNIIPLYLFKKLNIGLLEETNHVFGLADGTKSYPTGIVRDVEVHIRRLKLLTDFYVIDMKKDPETPLLVGRGFLATANAVIDCRKAKIIVEEGIIRQVFRVKGIELGAQTPYYARKDFLDCHLPGEWEIARDAEINPFKDDLVIFDEKNLGSS
ncbi:MAK10-like protein [Tanacetum coccineum]